MVKIAVKFNIADPVKTKTKIFGENLFTVKAITILKEKVMVTIISYKNPEDWRGYAEVPEDMLIKPTRDELLVASI